MNALVVEPDIRILEILKFHLSKLQFEVQTANSLSTAVSMARRLKPPIILFGVGEDSGDTVRQCKLLRSATEDPILVAIGSQEAIESDPMLRTHIDHALIGEFKIGPFLRDIRRLVWRRKGILCPAQANPIQCGQFAIAPSQGLLHVHDRSIPISPHEADLMYCLAQRSPEAAPRDTLLNLIWGAAPHGVSDRRVEVCVHAIRQKIEPDPAHPVHLVLRRGVGYVLTGGQTGESEPTETGPATQK